MFRLSIADGNEETYITYIKLFIRFLLALSTGYLHPDEIFQAFEPLSHVLVPWRISATIPWEFSCETPIRSTVSPILLLGPPFACLRIVTDLFNLHSPDPLVIFALCQLYVASVTLCIEHIFLEKIKLFLGVEIARLTSILLSLSWPVGVIMSRPFSNTVEAWGLALFLVSAMQFYQFISDRKRIRAAMEISWIAFLLSVGTFARFTFLFYAAPVCLVILFLVVYKETQERGYRLTIEYLGPIILLGFICLFSSVSIIVLLDTVYFGGSSFGSLFPFSFQNLWNNSKLTPVNSFLYNSQASNLAIHGTHPHWLHSIVNMSLLFGPLWILVVGVSIVWFYQNVFLQSLSSNKNSLLILLCSSTIISGLFFLSLATHQEPRFLLPLSFPLSVCGAYILTQLSSTNQSYLLSKHYQPYVKPFFFTVFFLFNIILILFFGFFHQGGIKPLTSIISSAISSSSTLMLHPLNGTLFSFASSAHFTWSGLLSYATLNSTLISEAFVMKKTRTIVFFSTYPSSQALLFQDENYSRLLTKSELTLFPQAPWCEKWKKTLPTSRPLIQSINVGSSTISALDAVLNEQFARGPANAIVAAPSHLSHQISEAVNLACTGLGYESGKVGEPLVSSWPHVSMENLPSSPLSLSTFSLEARFVECLN
jgi:GPI mannosyltransferase 4